MTTEESPLYLSKSTYCCLADDHYVFLDLRNDQYSCLGRTESNMLKGLLNGHQVTCDHPSDIRLIKPRDSDSSATIYTLLKKGLIVDNAVDGKLPMQPSVAPPAASLMESSTTTQPSFSLTDIWRFFSAAASASKDLRWRSIEETVRTVENRKSSRATVSDSRTISGLFEIFQALRPYYPRPYLCLFDSLALVHFLARYELFPLWVYGVTIEPFHAHCWVQVDDWLVNDTVDNVRDYTPIMCI